MKKKLVGILVCMLLIAPSLPVAGMINGINAEMKKEINSSFKDSLGITDIDWWPMWRHDSGNTGSSTSKAPNTNELSWQKYIGEEIYASAPIIV